VTEHLRAEGYAVINGDATRLDVLRAAHLDSARLVVVASPDAYQARAMRARAHQLNPGVEVLLRTHSDAERQFLEEMGAARALVGERELAVSLAREALQRFRSDVDMAQVAQRVLRPAATPETAEAS
jgi:CPA2 family monovalent cation:H+ antiporter-2